jgi:hypothetical protein
MLRHLWVDRAEAIIEEVHVRLIVQCAGKRDSLLLTTAEIDSLLSNLRCISVREERDVVRQRARRDDLGVACLVPRTLKENVAAQRCVLNPWYLRAVRDAATHRNSSTRSGDIAEEGAKELMMRMREEEEGG